MFRRRARFVSPANLVAAARAAWRPFLGACVGAWWAWRRRCPRCSRKLQRARLEATFTFGGAERTGWACPVEGHHFRSDVRVDPWSHVAVEGGITIIGTLPPEDDEDRFVAR